MENNIKKRMCKALKELEISVNELSKSRQLIRSTVNDQVNGNSKLGVATVEALLSYRPDISAEWLLRGKGSMLLNGNSAEGDEAGDVAELRNLIRRQQREIDGLYERIAELKRGNTTAAIPSVNVG